MDFANKTKSSISLKITLLAFIAYIITNIVSAVTDFYASKLCVLVSLYICGMSLVFFVFSLIHDLLGKLGGFFTSILTFIYLTIGTFALYKISTATFIAEYDMIIWGMDIVWKIFVCIDGILIFCKIAYLLFAKKGNSQNVSNTVENVPSESIGKSAEIGQNTSDSTQN